MRYPDDRTPLAVNAAAKSLVAIIRPRMSIDGKNMRDHSYVTSLCERRHLVEVCANGECQLRRNEHDEYLGRLSPPSSGDLPQSRSCSRPSITKEMSHKLRRSSITSDLSDPDTDSASETEVERNREDISNLSTVHSIKVIDTITPDQLTIVESCTMHTIQPDFILTPPVTPCPKCNSPTEQSEPLAKQRSSDDDEAENDVEDDENTYSETPPTPDAPPTICDTPEPVTTSISNDGEFCSSMPPVVVQMDCEPAPDGVEQFIVNDPFAAPIVTYQSNQRNWEPIKDQKIKICAPTAEVCVSNVTPIGTYYQYHDSNNAARMVKKRRFKGQGLTMSCKDTINVKIVNGCIVHISDAENVSERAPNTYRALTGDDNDDHTPSDQQSLFGEHLQGSARTGNHQVIADGVVNSPYPLCDHSYYNSNLTFPPAEGHSPRSPSKEPNRRSSEILRAALLNNAASPPVYSQNRPPPPPYNSTFKEEPLIDLISEADRAEIEAKLRFAADERRSKKIRRKQSQIRKLRLTTGRVPYTGTPPSAPVSTSSPSNMDEIRHPPMTSRQRAIHERNGSYVKITGSYQDDYVYYATKRSRGRPRKPSNDDTSGFLPKEPYPVGQIAASLQPALPQGATVKNTVSAGSSSNEFFDWYHDLAKTEDKDSHFSGTPSAEVSKESEVADLVINMEIDQSTAMNKESTMTPEAFLSLLNDMGPTGLQELERTLSVGYDPLVDEADQSSCQPIAAAATTTVQQDADNRTNVGCPPQLTTVTMYWNDLPGLIINRVQCIRLVDIHKQILPAKDTGILKKRCLMLSMQVRHCSELERDFLIRYANAAKSKSLLIIDKSQAQRLIAFYVNPRPRVHRSTSDYNSSDELSVEDLANQQLKEKTITPRRTMGLPYHNRRKHRIRPSPTNQPPVKRVRRQIESPASQRDLVLPRRSNHEKGRYATMLYGEKTCNVNRQRLESEDEDVNVVDTSDDGEMSQRSSTITVTKCSCSSDNTNVHCDHYAVLDVNRYEDELSPCIVCNRCRNDRPMSLADYLSHRHTPRVRDGNLRHLVSPFNQKLSINLWNEFKRKSTYLSTFTTKSISISTPLAENKTPTNTSAATTITSSNKVKSLELRTSNRVRRRKLLHPIEC